MCGAHEKMSVMEFRASPCWWTVTLTDGGKLRVMADSAEDSSESVNFDLHVVASEHELAAWTVAQRSEADPRLAVIRVAEVPIALVSDWET